jgi:hypothetical protein
MPATYVNIATTTLGSNTTSVTFSGIPSTYTDLVVRMSVRGNDSTPSDWALVRFNSDTATNYSVTRVFGDGVTANSGRNSSATSTRIFGAATAAGATANTFSNLEIYIPSYTASQNKPFSAFGASENNATTAEIAANAGLWRNTATISSMAITPFGSTLWLSGSTFYLYGIKNS